MPFNATRLPLLELDLLQTLIAIADTGSFSAAAEKISRTPSAVSMQVKRLEELIGQSVFVRTSRSVALTKDGEYLLEHARRMLEMNQDAVAHFINPDVSGLVRLGAPDEIAQHFLVDMLRRFSASHPSVTVDVVVEDSASLHNKIKQQQVDLAVLTCDTNAPGVDILFQEPLVWGSLRGGAAATKTPLPISAWEENCVWRTAAIAALERHNRDYRVTFTSSHISGQRAAILADVAVAPIPQSSLTDEIVATDAKHGLPELPGYALSLVVADNAGPHVEAAADHLRRSFAGVCNAIITAA